MNDDRMIRFQGALEKVRQKSIESKSDEATLSLSLTVLQVAIDNIDVDKALEIFESCSEIYSSLDEPENWMGNRLGQLSSRLQVLIKGSGKYSAPTYDESLSPVEQ